MRYLSPAGLITLMQQKENSLKEFEVLQKFIPFAPTETSYRMGWKGMQAVRYERTPASAEFSVPPVSLHTIALILRPPEKLNVRFAELKLDRSLPTGSIFVVPAGSSILWRWQGIKDSLHVYLEPSLVSRVAAELFEFDSTRTVMPPFYSVDAPGLRSAIMGVYQELRADGGDGEQLLVESLATILSVHLIRHITRTPRPPVPADGVLSRRKLQAVIEYIMENLEGNPTLAQMAAVANISPCHFARQFKASTRLAPHQYLIARRIERAQHLLQAHDELGLAEVALRVGFADQSHFSFHFKRLVGVTPRQFRISERILQRRMPP